MHLLRKRNYTFIKNVRDLILKNEIIAYFLVEFCRKIAQTADFLFHVRRGDMNLKAFFCNKKAITLFTAEKPKMDRIHVLG